MKKNLIFFFFLSISLFFIIFILYKKKLSIFDSFSAENIFYIFVIIIFFILPIKSFYSNKNTNINYFIFFCSSFITLLSLEFLTFLFFNEIMNFKKGIFRDFDNRSRIEVFKDNEKSDKNFKIIVNPTNYLNDKDIEIFPLSGNSNSKIINCNENGYYSIHNTDRFGFNNPDKVWTNELNKPTIITLGDSFTFGSCVNSGNEFAGHLRKMTNRYNIVNLGYGGTGPLMQYATFKEYSKMINNLNYLIWFFYEGNDFKDLNKEIINSYLKKYNVAENFNQNLIKKQKQINEMANKKIELFSEKKVNIFQILKIVHLRKLFFNNKYSNDYFRDYNLYKEILFKTLDDLDKNKAKLIVVYLPEYARYVHNNFDYKHKIDLINFFSKWKIDFYDADEMHFSKEKLDYSFPFGLNGHYTIKMYKDIANGILQKIIE